MAEETEIALHAAGRSFVIAAPPHGSPRLVYWGPDNAFCEAPGDSQSPLPASPDVRRVNELAPLEGYGFFGEPALLAHGENGSVFSLTLFNVQADKSECTLSYRDDRKYIELDLFYALDPSGLLNAHARLKNTGDKTLYLQRLNALTLPLPSWAKQADLTFGGWSSEGRSARVPLIAGKIERSGRSGRPGFDGGPHLVLTSDGTTENAGSAIGLALAHSGNFTLAAETSGSGEAQAIIAEWLHPGEIMLPSGSAYQTPKALAALSTSGLNGLSQTYHAYARASAPETRRRRPVQLNSWEAVYFGVDEKTAMRLADEAFAIGAERFVLDDGWFKGRHHDRAALGDWTPDPEKFPGGFAPLANHVTGLGLEFGLWVEPEMVNEDSDFYRSHPDWILSVDGKAGPTARHQLVLNLTHEDVRDYLFTSLDTLLKASPISYLKWDCNRDLFPAATPEGPASRGQITGLYALLDRLRAANPNVSIESCASGGGRMDFGVLTRADRFWASDATDAIERIRIQRRASLFYPVDMLGAHVGSSPNHWTRRRLPMAFRCLTAFFGHFGVELDPATLNDMDKVTLKRAIALYKTYRPIITEGTLWRFDNPDPALDVQAMIAPDGATGLLRILRSGEPARLSLPAIRLSGLPANQRWRITTLAIEGDAAPHVLGEVSSESLAFQGLSANPSHTAEGLLFLMERIA